MLSLNEIKELMKLLEASPLSKIELTYGDGSVLLEKSAAPAAPVPAPAASAAPAAVPQPAAPEPAG